MAGNDRFHTAKRRSILQSIAAGALATSTGTGVAGAADTSDDFTTSSTSNCGSWEYIGSFCPQTASDYSDFDASPQSSECYYEYECRGTSGYYRRECCYDPYQLESDEDSITVEPVGVTHHADLVTAMSRESEWVEAYPDSSHSYWKARFNISSNAQSYDDDDELACLLTESSLEVSRSGDGHLYTWIDGGGSEEDYVGATNNLDKSTEYDVSDYGKEFIDFALGELPRGIGTTYSAGQTLASMLNMATDEYDSGDTIGLGYNWAIDSPCSSFAAEARHWLLFEVKQMQGGDTAELTVNDEIEVNGPTMSNELTMSASAPPEDPGTLRSMSDTEQRRKGMNTVTMREVKKNPHRYNIREDWIEDSPPEALVYVG